MAKRIVLSQLDYSELKDGLSWCNANGFTGLSQWYREELAVQAKRYALPPGATEYRDLEDDRPPRGGRRD